MYSWNFSGRSTKRMRSATAWQGIRPTLWRASAAGTSRPADPSAARCQACPKRATRQARARRSATRASADRVRTAGADATDDTQHPLEASPSPGAHDIERRGADRDVINEPTQPGQPFADVLDAQLRAWREKRVRAEHSDPSPTVRLHCKARVRLALHATALPRQPGTRINVVINSRLGLARCIRKNQLSNSTPRSTSARTPHTPDQARDRLHAEPSQASSLAASTATLRKPALLDCIRLDASSGVTSAITASSSSPDDSDAPRRSG